MICRSSDGVSTGGLHCFPFILRVYLHSGAAFNTPAILRECVRLLIGEAFHLTGCLATKGGAVHERLRGIRGSGRVSVFFYCLCICEEERVCVCGVCVFGKGRKRKEGMSGIKREIEREAVIHIS